MTTINNPNAAQIAAIKSGDVLSVTHPNIGGTFTLTVDDGGNVGIPGLGVTSPSRLVGFGYVIGSVQSTNRDQVTVVGSITRRAYGGGNNLRVALRLPSGRERVLFEGRTDQVGEKSVTISKADFDA